MGLLDDMQEIILIDRMEERQARHVAGLREKLSETDLNEDALAALELMYSTGWKDCIAEMRKLRDGR